MKNIDLLDFLNEIKVTMKRKKISQAEISKELHMNVATVSFTLAGKRGTFFALKKIINYINSK